MFTPAVMSAMNKATDSEEGGVVSRDMVETLDVHIYMFIKLDKVRVRVSGKPIDF